MEVIRSPGETCPAEGFIEAAPVGRGFRLRNQLCSGWLFVDEVMTFAPSPDGYVLVHFSAEYTDRRTAELDGPARVLTQEQLGERLFDKLDPDELYRLLE